MVAEPGLHQIADLVDLELLHGVLELGHHLALAELPEEQRSAVALVLIEGLSYREAADILGVPIGTVTSRLSRAREALVARVFGKDAQGAVL